MPNGDSTDQWFLEVNGKKFGPYTMAQINALVRHQEIVGEDRVTAPHLSGKWISVQEFVNQSDPAESSKRSAKTIPQNVSTAAAASSTVPPRPDERTLTSITAPSHHSHHESRNSGSDAILNLFEILQTARERKSQTPSIAGHQIVEMPRPVKTSSGGGLFWFAMPALVVAAVVVWKMTGSISTPVAEVESTSKATKTAPNPPANASTHPVQAAPPRPAVVAAPMVKPKVVVSLPSGFTAGRQQIRPPQAQPAVTDRERERELEREREREAERELEREKERETESARNYSSNEPTGREKERAKERETERERPEQRMTASTGAPTVENALPVTGGIPAEPSSFKEAGSETESPQRPVN